MSNLVILCVDDERMVLNSLKRELQSIVSRKRVALELAESAEEGLAVHAKIVADQKQLAVLITDQIMPGMKGDELIILLHAKSPTTVTILLTGQANADAVGNVVNHAALYRYIRKPWESTDLQLTVSEAVNRYLFDAQIKEQQKLIEDLQANLIENFASSEQIKLSDEQLNRKVFFQRFLNFLEPTLQKWVIEATIGLICADQKVTENEMLYVNALVSVNRTTDHVRWVVERIKSKHHPQLEVCKTDMHQACYILIQLLNIVVNDGKISKSENEYLIYVGGKLGLTKGTSQPLINLALQEINTNREKQKIINSIKHEKPVYTTYT